MCNVILHWIRVNLSLKQLPKYYFYPNWLALCHLHGSCTNPFSGALATGLRQQLLTTQGSQNMNITEMKTRPASNESAVMKGLLSVLGRRLSHNQHVYQPHLQCRPLNSGGSSPTQKSCRIAGQGWGVIFSWMLSPRDCAHARCIIDLRLYLTACLLLYRSMLCAYRFASVHLSELLRHRLKQKKKKQQ